MSRNERLLLWGLVAAAFGLRLLPAVSTDFQVDEILSLTQTLRAHSPWDVLVHLNNDNNHRLNTLYMYVAGFLPQWWIYRIPSVLCGAATVWVMYAVSRRHLGATAATAGAALATFAYPMIFYSAEARGYACAALMTVVALHFFLRVREAEVDRRGIAGFWLACTVGVFAHFSFLMVWAGFCLADVLLLPGGEARTLRSRLTRFLFLQAPLAVGFGALYLFHLRGMQILGGGGIDGKLMVAGWWLAESANFPVGGGLGATVAGSALVLVPLAFGLVFLRREKSPLWAVGVSVLVVAPVAVVAVSQPVHFHPRYMFVLLPLFLMLVGGTVARLWGGNRGRRLLAGLFLGLFSVLGGLRISALLADGKSHYFLPLKTMAGAMPSDGTVLVAGTKQPAQQQIVNYYRLVLGPGAPDMKVVSLEDAMKGKATCEWVAVVVDSLAAQGLDPDTIPSLCFDGHVYARQKSPRSADRLDADWIFFRKEK